MKDKVLSLTLAERIAIVGIIPLEGDRSLVRLCKRIVRAVELTKEEVNKFNVGKNGDIAFSKIDLQSNEVPITLSHDQFDFIKTEIGKIEQTRKLSYDLEDVLCKIESAQEFPGTPIENMKAIVGGDPVNPVGGDPVNPVDPGAVDTVTPNNPHGYPSTRPGLGK